MTLEKERPHAVLGTCEYRAFTHHLYEYEKGLRNLVLYTTNDANREFIEGLLQSKKVDYCIRKVDRTKINVFFGDRGCIDVVRLMNFRLLSSLKDEEDFILGIMLGYDRLKQCERYLERKNNGAKGA